MPGSHPRSEEDKLSPIEDEEELLAQYDPRLPGPLAGLGILLGSASGIIAIQVEHDHAGLKSWDSFARKLGLHQPTLTIASQRTTFRLLSIRENPGRVPERLDPEGFRGIRILGEAALIPAAPTPDLYHKDAYELCNQGDFPAKATDKLLELVENQKRDNPVLKLQRTEKSLQEVRRYLLSFAWHLQVKGVGKERALEIMMKKNKTFSSCLPEDDVAKVQLEALFMTSSIPFAKKPRSHREHALLMQQLMKTPILWDPLQGKAGKAWKWKDGKWILEALTICLEELYETSRAFLDEVARKMRDGKSKKYLRDYLDYEVGNSDQHRKILEAFKTLPGIMTNMKDLCDKHQFQLNLANGTYDFLMNDFYPNFEKDFHTKIANVNYDPSAECPTWLEFLSTITQGDTDHIRLLQKSVGYSLIEGNKLRLMFILFGKGANGKSTFLHVIQALLGDYAKSTSIQNFTNKAAIRNGIARLAGARLVIVDEAEGDDGDFLTAPLMKQISGGVDQVEARFLFQENFEFTPGFKVFIASNHLPAFKVLDQALEARIVPIPFDAVIPEGERNPNMAEQLKNELPGILNWAMRGLSQVLLEGIDRPWRVRKLLFRYKNVHNAIQRFLNDSCEILPKGEIGSFELYELYRRYCTLKGEGRPMMQKSFNERLEQAGFHRKRKSEGWRVLGVKIRDDYSLMKIWGVELDQIKG
jgi:P4 family phage/plasmid primase-like protien